MGGGVLRDVLSEIPALSSAEYTVLGTTTKEQRWELWIAGA